MKTILLATALAIAPVLAVPAFAVDTAAPAAGASDPAPAAASTPAASPRAKMMFWFLDRNGDGVIDATEITAFRTARFNALDANGDGKLTKEEALAGMAGWRDHGPRKGGKPGGPMEHDAMAAGDMGPDGAGPGPDGPGPGPGPKGPDGKGPDGKGPHHGDKKEHRAEWKARQEKREARMLERMGFTDGVTEITLATFLAQPMPMLMRVDIDKNGSITREEFLAAAAKVRGPAPN